VNVVEPLSTFTKKTLFCDNLSPDKRTVIKRRRPSRVNSDYEHNLDK